jgi:endonuclease/exonuclease/phosphatase family metal-dependent hydrolase
MKRLLMVCALLAGVLLSAGPAGAGADAHTWRPVRVASYNIQAGAGSDHVFDLDRTAAAIRDLDADVVGLQEVDVHWSARSQWRDLASELGRELGMHVFFAPIYSLDPLEPGQPRREYGVALLSKHRILYAKNHEITRLSTQVPNPVPEPAPGFPEIVINVRGALVHVYTTHLDYRGDPSVREAQVADTLRIMGRHRDQQQILVGDLNARPDAPELAPLWELLQDSWATANGPDGGLSYPAAQPDRRIDYVTATSRIRVRSAEVVDTQASDHLPLVADLLLRSGR